ncbi:MAG: hypothetical protein AAGF29_02180 [Pseudomonadota bacterium]
MATGTTAPAQAANGKDDTPLKKAEKATSSAARKVRKSVRSAAAEVSGQAENLAEDTVHLAKTKADEAVRVGQSRTESVVRSLGRAMEAGSRSLAEDGMTGTAGYVRAAADGLNSAADEVDGFEPGRLTSRVEEFVRERPMLTVGALAIAGFALASALKPPRDA